MNPKNLFANFTKFEISLWGISCSLILLLFAVNPHRNLLTLIASLIGVTALIYLAKGHVAGQLLTILFSLFYGVISYGFQYYGEMITYLGMTAPTALIAAIEWIRHPYEKGNSEVKVAKLTCSKQLILFALAGSTTYIFYFILKHFNTANLPISTISVTTSFLASGLMVLRSPFYAVAYAANDVILIILWFLASIEDVSFLPMVLCFCIFLCNDLYGFINWRKMQDKQSKVTQPIT